MANAHNYGLILAGGRGTRFWPRSRRANAKQVLKFFGDRTLIQQTVDRLRPVLPPERIWVMTNDHLRAEIVRQLPEVPKNQILAEPAQRNTAPAIGLAAHILESIDPEAVMGVFPADHVITDNRAFARVLKPAFREAAKGRIVVMGIRPPLGRDRLRLCGVPQGPGCRLARAHPGEPASARSPDLKTAKKFVAAGRFYWNAGMFFWRAGVLLEELRAHLPDTAKLIDGLPPFGHRQFVKRTKAEFPQAENISIDFAVLENSTRVSGIPAGDIGWNDVGSWSAVYELEARDEHENAARGQALFSGSTGNYVDAGGKLVALLGVNNLVVVETPDALLVADRSRAQDVGELVKLLEKQGRHHLL